MKRLLILLLLALLPALAFAQSPDPGFGRYRNTALSSTDIAIKAGSSGVFGFTFTNVNTTTVYVKFYNGNASSVVVGTTVPAAVVAVPAGTALIPITAMLAPGGVPWLYVNTGLVIAAVTGLADNSTAAPATAIYVEVQYK